MRVLPRHQKVQLSVIVPVYQECEVIRSTIESLVEVLTSWGGCFEIIVVDDGSTDGTAAVLSELAQQCPAHVLRIITHPYNKGNGAAIKTGMRAALGEIIACMDAGGQHDPQDLLRLLPHVADYDLVVGARTLDHRSAYHRRMANRFFNFLASRLTRFPVQDLTSGFRVFRATVVRQYVHLFPAGFSYPTTSTLAFLKAGRNVKYIPIKTRRRMGNHSKIRALRDGWRFLIIIFKIVVIFEPLRVFLPTALVLLTGAVLSAAYSTLSIGRLYMPNSAVLLFLTGVLVLLLGFMAEQLAALHISTRDEV